ncbi:hypothetical protein TNCV_123591 [Trichonephila clavipes]|nr:hypothetical protein TNCV_123591 [Trichonephila clavipes]
MNEYTGSNRPQNNTLSSHKVWSFVNLLAHALDLDDSAVQHVTALLSTETWINNEENIGAPNFPCIAKFQRHRADGVDIYKNKVDTTTDVTSKMDVASNTTE